MPKFAYFFNWKFHSHLQNQSINKKLRKSCDGQNKTMVQFKTTSLSSCLNNMLPEVTHHYKTRNSGELAAYQTWTNIFKYSFFLYSITAWNKLSSNNRNSTHPVFRNHLLNIIRPGSNQVYNIQNHIGLKLLTRLRLGLSHL